jgi:hypothetical protein
MIVKHIYLILQIILILRLKIIRIYEKFLRIIYIIMIFVVVKNKIDRIHWKTFIIHSTNIDTI